MVKLTTEKFLEKSKLIHGDRYDYSLVEYINAVTKVKIICPEHGLFEQTPNKHIHMKHGCYICNGGIKINKEKFIERAKLKHGDRYDYSLVEYRDNKTKVKIICSDHGVFKQVPYNHIQSKGCMLCYREKQTLEVQKFIEKAKQIHGDRYDYSLTEYENTKTKVKIICKTHGIFEQTPNRHMAENGCPICCESRGEKEIAKYLENNNIMFEREKTFNNCRNKNVLPFDFYLLEKNVLIEYDGEQHFKSIDFFGGKQALNELKKRDAIKTKYCEDNNITLLRIRYDEKLTDKLDRLVRENI